MQQGKPSHSRELARELYLFTIIGLLGSCVYSLFYGIFLYRHTFDIKVLTVDSFLVALSAWVGYILGTFWIHRQGYLNAMKVSFLLFALTSFLTLLLTQHISELYPVLSIMRGVPFGIFTSIIDIYLLKELSGLSRGRYFIVNLSFEFTIAVFVPFLLGSLIGLTSNYRLVFVLAGAIYLFGLLLPVRYNKRPKSRVSLNDEIALLRRKGICEYNINTVLTMGADQLNVLLIAIVPFLILGSEFRVGSFTSLIDIMAAIVAFASQKFSYPRQVMLGYIGNLGRFISNTILAFFWNPVALFAQGITNQAMSPLNDPVFKRIRVENEQRILRSDINEMALEMNLINATMSLIGECGALVTFLLVLVIIGGNQIDVVRVLLIVYGIWKVANYIWVLGMRRRFSQSAGTPETTTEITCL